MLYGFLNWISRNILWRLFLASNIYSLYFQQYMSMNYISRVDRVHRNQFKTDIRYQKNVVHTTKYSLRMTKDGIWSILNTYLLIFWFDKDLRHERELLYWISISSTETKYYLLITVSLKNLRIEFHSCWIILCTLVQHDKLVRNLQEKLCWNSGF